MEKKIVNYQDYTVQIENIQIEPKNLVRWLDIWLDSKLNFKEHVEKKIANATRVFHQITRLSNTERGLFFSSNETTLYCLYSVNCRL